MKRIDLHIHTIKTQSDSNSFDFDIEVLKAYINDAKLDAIAITNHNTFSLADYEAIKNSVSISVFPGVELNVTTPGGFGHVLVIAPENDVVAFNECMSKLDPLYTEETSRVPWEDIVQAFPGINTYLIIPHFKKHKSIDSQTLETIKNLTGISALEVDNNKKWLRYNDTVDLPLVVFSDARPGLKMPGILDEDTGVRYSYGFTYIECDDMHVPSIKTALTQKRNVSIFKANNEFEILPESLAVSKRLNVVLGDRSSGKTYTLERIRDAYSSSDCKYIQQFEITADAEKNKFLQIVESSDESFFSDYFLPFQNALSDYLSFDFDEPTTGVEDYCEALIVYANSPEDDCSKCPIYSAEPYTFEKEDKRMKDDSVLIDAIRTLSSEIERKELLTQFFSDDSLDRAENALNELIEADYIKRTYKELSNTIITSIKTELVKIAARKPLPSNDPIKTIFKERYYENELSQILDALKESKSLGDEDLGKFKKTRLRKFNASSTDARAIKPPSLIPTGTDLQGLFKAGITSTEQLRKVSSYNQTLYPYACRLLFKISTSIVNNNAENTPLSGGQRAEYIFLDKLDKAKNADVVLIDEPESSFDNVFLNKDVLGMLNDLADHSTVFLVTHNNTLGVSIAPNRILYAQKGADDIYRVFSGQSTSEYLDAVDGTHTKRATALLDSMEAGINAYDGRKPYYAIT